MELTEIIAKLENNTGKFSRLALERAIEEREAITPLLLATLEKWKDNLEELLELPDYFLHIYALFLLAQFKETQAYPLIIEFFSAPGDISLDVTGDLVTEDLGRIFANVSDGNIEPLKELIENRQANEFVRGAALNSLMVLVAQGVISRELVIEYFEELFSTKLEKEPSYIWTDLVINSARLYPEELNPHIAQAFESDLVDLFFIDYEDIDYYLKIGKEATLNQLSDNEHYSFIEDTIAELEWWACFSDESCKKITNKSLEIGKFGFNLSLQKKSNQSKKKAKRKMQKQARRKNRSKKK
ncbi:MAG: DUF1186 domain-containing protein [Xenococcaceae cyanobacterium]